MEQHDKERMVASMKSILADQFPDLPDQELEVREMPAQQPLRQLRRLRGYVAKSEIESLPTEYEIVYRLPTANDQGIEKTIVVVADQQGKPKLIIESK